MEKREELLAQAEFIQRLSRRLILDNHRAEDLAQDLWVAYLENPPNPRVSLRSWLSGTLLNISRMMFRSSRRREKRELVYASQQGDAFNMTRVKKSIGEDCEKAEILQQVVDVLLSLQEPFRTTLLLRFYQDLPYKDVAVKLNIPIDTMKYRLKRGLALMQEKLDRIYKGDRGKWTASLLPFTGLVFADSAAATATMVDTLVGPSSHEMQGDSGMRGESTPPAAETPVHDIEANSHFSGIWSEPDSTGSSQNLCVEKKRKAMGARNLCHVAGIAGLLFVAWLVWGIWPEPQVARSAPGSEEETRITREEPESSGLSTTRIPRDALLPAIDAPQDETPAAIAWAGSLIDYTGLTMSDAVIGLRRKDHQADGGVPLFSARTDADGSFRFTHLPSDDYELFINFPRTQYYATSREKRLNDAFVPWGEIRLDESLPNDRELDVLSMDNAVVCVKVIDDTTGMPAYRDGIEVWLYNHPMCNTYFQTTVDPQTGIACFRCVPPDTYYLLLFWPNGFNQRHETHIEVAGGRVKNDITVKVPPLGRLSLRLEGFTEEGRARLEVRCMASKSELREFDNLSTLNVFEFEEGPLRVDVACPDRVRWTRTIDIEKGKEVEAVIYPGDLESKDDDECSMDVPGRITRPDGTPLDEVFIQYGKCRYGNLRKTKILGFCDDLGCFTLPDCKPGIYGFSLFFLHPEDRESYRRSNEGSSITHSWASLMLKGFEVEAPSSMGRASPGQELRLIVPEGRVRGAIFDGSDGIPICDKVKEWTVTVNMSRQDGRLITSFLGRGDSSEFTMQGIPAGDYFLSVDCHDYFHYKSELFSLEEGEALDLGKIMLTPSGIFDLMIYYPDGSPARFFQVYYNEKILGQGGGSKKYKIRGPDSPVRRYSGLPSGPGELIIVREGYHTLSVPLYLNAGVPEWVELTLEEDPEAMDTEKEERGQEPK